MEKKHDRFQGFEPSAQGCRFFERCIALALSRNQSLGLAVCFNGHLLALLLVRSIGGLGLDLHLHQLAAHLVKLTSQGLGNLLLLGCYLVCALQVGAQLADASLGDRCPLLHVGQRVARFIDLLALSLGQLDRSACRQL
jgi:hypothetical protein